MSTKIHEGNQTFQLSPLLERMFQRFNITAQDLGFDTVPLMHETASDKTPRAKEHREWAKVVFLRLMEEDKDTITFSAPDGNSLIKEGGQLKTEYRSRWAQPFYSKSMAPGAADSGPNFWFEFCAKHFDEIMQVVECTATEPDENGKPVATKIAHDLSPKNPRRRKALEIMKELKEKNATTFKSLFDEIYGAK